MYISWCVNQVTVFQNFGLLNKQYVAPAPLRHISLGKGSIEGDRGSTMYWNRSYVDVYTINKKCNISGCIRRLMTKLVGANVLWIWFYMYISRNTKWKKINIVSSISTKKRPKDLE